MENLFHDDTFTICDSKAEDWKKKRNVKRTGMKFDVSLDESSVCDQFLQPFNFRSDQKVKYQDLNENYDLTQDDPYKEIDSSSEESEEDSESADDARDVKVRATSLGSQALSFTVKFKGDKQERVSKNNPKQPKNSGFKSFQQGLADKASYPNPVVPNLEDGSIFSSYGLPKSLLHLVQDVVHLTNHKNVFRTRGQVPRNFPRICAETEDKILNFNVENHWKLYDNEYNPITNVATKTFISEFHEGLYHNVTYFHNALIVYFFRSIVVEP